MPAVASHSVLLNLSQTDAWTKLRDLSLAPQYVPGLTGGQLHPGPREGLGASRRVFRKGGQWLDESVVQWRDGEGFVLMLHKGNAGAPFPFRQATFEYRLQAQGDATQITTRMHYSLRGGRIVEALLGKAFIKVVQQIAENLKVHYETGQTQNGDLAQGRI